MLSRVCTEAGAVVDVCGNVESGGKEAGPGGAGEAVGEVAMVVVGWVMTVDVGIEADAVGLLMPIPIFASCPELVIAMGSVGLCCECCRECKPPAALPLLPAPVPTLVGGLNAPSDIAVPVPVLWGPPSRADPGGLEEMCEVGGDEDDEPKEEVEEWE